MLKRYLPVAAIYALVITIMYNKEIAGILRIFLDDTIVRPTMGLITVTMFLYILKNFWDRYLNLTSEKDKKLESSFASLNTDVGVVKTDVKKLREDVAHVKLETEKTTAAINDINEYKDDKKRRAKEFESDWSGMKDTFTPQGGGDTDVYCTARMFKESLSEMASDFQAVDIYGIQKKEVLEIFKEKYYDTRDSNFLLLKLQLPIDYVEYLFKSQEINEAYLWEEISRVLDDGVNKRGEGIHLVVRQFFRRTLNTIYRTWVKYTAEEKKEADPSGAAPVVSILD